MPLLWLLQNPKHFIHLKAFRSWFISLDCCLFIFAKGGYQNLFDFLLTGRFILWEFIGQAVIPSNKQHNQLKYFYYA